MPLILIICSCYPVFQLEDKVIKENICHKGMFDTQQVAIDRLEIVLRIPWTDCPVKFILKPYNEEKNPIETSSIFFFLKLLLTMSKRKRGKGSATLTELIKWEFQNIEAFLASKMGLGW